MDGGKVAEFVLSYHEQRPSAVAVCTIGGGQPESGAAQLFIYLS